MMSVCGRTQTSTVNMSTNYLSTDSRRRYSAVVKRDKRRERLRVSDKRHRKSSLHAPPTRAWRPLAVNSAHWSSLLAPSSSPTSACCAKVQEPVIAHLARTFGPLQDTCPSPKTDAGNAPALLTNGTDTPLRQMTLTLTLSATLNHIFLLLLHKQYALRNHE